MRIHKKKSLGIIVAFFLVIYMFLLSSKKSSVIKSTNELKEMKKSILELSKNYIHSLAGTLYNVEDGPAAYPETAYDMKKALAVLIDDMNSEIVNLKQRIMILEDEIKDNVTRGPTRIPFINQDNFETKNKSDSANKNIITMIDLIQSKQDICPFPSFDGWPHCNDKIVWMREMWESDKCYGDWGVDGSDCSILMYLSEHEKFCPPFEWRVNKTIVENKNKVFEYAKVQASMNGLLTMLKKRDEQYKWLRLRIERMQNKWLNAAKKLEKKYNLSSRKKKRVLFHMGLLNEETGWDIAKNAFSGGPLGELVQWSDLLSAVFVLGHNVTVSTYWRELFDMFHPYLYSASTSCPLKATPFDIIYTDITGLKVFKSLAKQRFHLLECNIRILDSFGTEPEYNSMGYAQRKQHKGGWGSLQLNPKQFFTMFPHTPDNTFLGFVVEEHLGDDIVNNQTFKKENIALVYGKRDEFWEGKSNFLSSIHDFIEVHGTVDKTLKKTNIPSYVVNHGVLPGKELHQLLRKTKIFIGMGFPYEGPAPLEAIANGAVFLNPVFKEPLNYKNTKFFEGKPTSRKLTSQHPYAEKYIGKPHVRSVDFDDLESVKSTVKDILNKDTFKSFLPLEFTCEGMLERLSFYIEKQDFCTGSVIPIWPPESALQIKISDKEQSCNDVCDAHNLICEPTYFPTINKKSVFSSLGIECAEFFSPSASNTEIDFPAYLHQKCFLQTDDLLFSCAGRYTDFNRICPCRDYIKGQIALCKDCLIVEY